MRTTKIARALLVLGIAGAGLVAASVGTASAAAVSMDLCALPGTATLTGSTTVPIWGFGIPTTAATALRRPPACPDRSWS